MGKTLQQAHTKNQVAVRKGVTGGEVGPGSLHGRTTPKTGRTMNTGNGKIGK